MHLLEIEKKLTTIIVTAGLTSFSTHENSCLFLCSEWSFYSILCYSIIFRMVILFYWEKYYEPVANIARMTYWEKYYEPVDNIA